MAHEAGIPRADPPTRHGAVDRAVARVLGTEAGRWFAINVASRVDPVLLRVTHGKIGLAIGLPTANLTTTGAKSGAPRTATVVYFNDGDDVILIASSFGRDKHPNWYHNLKVHPRATLKRAGRTGTYDASEVDDEGERQRLFASADRVYAGYSDYRVRAAYLGRRIPIMRLRLVA
jgi:deazaflavin-dependent oxidoreductase (nitroreductase family)